MRKRPFTAHKLRNVGWKWALRSGGSEPEGSGAQASKPDWRLIEIREDNSAHLRGLSFEDFVVGDDLDIGDIAATAFHRLKIPVASPANEDSYRIPGIERQDHQTGAICQRRRIHRARHGVRRQHSCQFSIEGQSRSLDGAGAFDPKRWRYCEMEETKETPGHPCWSATTEKLRVGASINAAKPLHRSLLKDFNQGL